MTAADAIAASRATEEWLVANMDGLQSTHVDDRSRLAMALFDLVHEYHGCIILLLGLNRPGTAYALVRPLWETYLRGYWLLHCANDQEVDSFKRDQFDTSIARLVAAVERHMGNAGGVLTRIKNNFYGAMSSYTHGAYMQAVRRIGANEIRGDLFTDGERAEVATFTHAWALAAAHELFLLYDRPQLGQEALERATQIPRP
jgi:hypothetical protein